MNIILYKEARLTKKIVFSKLIVKFVLLTCIVLS